MSLYTTKNRNNHVNKYTAAINPMSQYMMLMLFMFRMPLLTRTTNRINPVTIENMESFELMKFNIIDIFLKCIRIYRK